MKFVCSVVTCRFVYFKFYMELQQHTVALCMSYSFWQLHQDTCDLFHSWLLLPALRLSHALTYSYCPQTCGLNFTAQIVVRQGDPEGDLTTVVFLRDRKS